MFSQKCYSFFCKPPMKTQRTAQRGANVLKQLVRLLLTKSGNVDISLFLKTQCLVTGILWIWGQGCRSESYFFPSVSDIRPLLLEESNDWQGIYLFPSVSSRSLKDSVTLTMMPSLRSWMCSRSGSPGNRGGHSLVPWPQAAQSLVPSLVHLSSVGRAFASWTRV